MIKFPFLSSLSILSLCVCLLAVTSCGPKKITPQSQLHDSVMEIHDEVMPKMSDIHKLKKALKNQLKEGPAIDQKVQINLLQASLNKADDAMMDWMAEYDKPSEGDAGAMAYLEGEKNKITQVQQEMLGAIKNAQKFIDAK